MGIAFKHSAGFGKRMEYKLIGDMLMEGLDCYTPLVDDHGVDCVIKKSDGTFIENVDIILSDGVSTFGNGVRVSVLNETGGCEVTIFDRLSAHIAYVMVNYRNRPGMISRLEGMIDTYVEGIKSDIGTIGCGVTIADAGYIKNVKMMIMIVIILLDISKMMNLWLVLLG